MAKRTAGLAAYQRARRQEWLSDTLTEVARLEGRLMTALDLDLASVEAEVGGGIWTSAWSSSTSSGARRTGGQTVSRTSKYYQRVTVIFRRAVCQWCGAELEHARTGRPRRFCSSRCRMAYNRAMKQHAQDCVEAALAGEPQPIRDFGQPPRLASYEIDRDGNVTKQARRDTKGG